MLNMDVEKPHIQRTDLKVTWGEPPRASGAALRGEKKKSGEGDEPFGGCLRDFIFGDVSVLYFVHVVTITQICTCDRISQNYIPTPQKGHMKLVT